MDIKITIPDQTYSWLSGVSGIGTPEEYIARVLGDNMRALLFQQPPPAMKTALDAVNALCKPVAERVTK